MLIPPFFTVLKCLTMDRYPLFAFYVPETCENYVLRQKIQERKRWIITGVYLTLISYSNCITSLPKEYHPQLLHILLTWLKAKLPTSLRKDEAHQSSSCCISFHPKVHLHVAFTLTYSAWLKFSLYNTPIGEISRCKALPNRLCITHIVSTFKIMTS
jgi:hypothetical protein